MANEQLPARAGGALPAIRDPRQTCYSPLAIAGLTPDDRVASPHRQVACDGGGGALGHPRIWMKIQRREVVCPYCSRTFVLAEGAMEESGH